MQKQNIREYELTRTELLQLKDCITTYMGYMLGGSGAILLCLPAIGRNGGANYFATVPLGVSFVISLVMFILFYKFISHNRLAGFCKLLNHEKYCMADSGVSICEVDDILSWEICIDRLRASDSDESLLYDDKLTYKGVDKEALFMAIKNFKSKNILNKSLPNGFSLVRCFLNKKYRTQSWAFPIHVTVVFLSLCSFFLFTGVAFSIICFATDHSLWSLSYIFLSVISCIVQYKIWDVYLEKLYDVMEGCHTIDSFCLYFIPIRIRYLKEIGNIIPAYSFRSI